jgi:mono/diheme cytochrome c family protein
MAAGAPGTVATPPVGSLLAWDPVAQKPRWRVEHPTIWNGGTLTTAGNLVFQGTGDGRFVAYRADTGAVVRELNVGSPIIAAPITYEIDNTQYVAVMAGYGGAIRVVAPEPPKVSGRLLVFALGGKATLAPPPTTSLPRPAAIAVPPTTSDTLMLGAVTYARRCSMCHGAEAASGGLAPDLRYSQPATFDRFEQIVLGGALASRGMPAFQASLTETELAAIKAYVLTQRAVLTQ